MPKVSVILTSYNHAKYLHESIESVLNQTFSDFELIIGDDASTDRSWEIIQSFADPRIRAFRHETNKMGFVINEAVSGMVSGEYIAVQHSDDAWEPDKLENQVAFLDENPQVGAVFSRATPIGEDGMPFVDTSHFYYDIFNQPNRNRFEWLSYFFYDGNALCHPSVLIRKTCYDNCGLYRYGLTQVGDLDMWVRVCMKYEIHILPERLVRFRIRASEMNTSGNRPDTRVRSRFELLHILNNYKNILTFAELTKIFPAAQKYSKPEGFDLDFALGMIVIEEKSADIYQLFGLNILFDILKDTVRAKKIEELYNFKHSDFSALTGQYDVFSVEEKAELISQLVKRATQVQVLTDQLAERNNQFQTLTGQLSEIRMSKAWRLVMVLRGLRDSLLPMGSWRWRTSKKMLVLLLFPFTFRGNRKTLRDRTLIRDSGFFDQDWYLAEYSDVAKTGIDPARHYLLSGGFEGRNPGPNFNSDWYLHTYQDVQKSGLNPLVHYLQFGQKEGRFPNPKFKAQNSLRFQSVVRKYDDVSTQKGYEYYLRRGLSEWKNKGIRTVWRKVIKKLEKSNLIELAFEKKETGVIQEFIPGIFPDVNRTVLDEINKTASLSETVVSAFGKEKDNEAEPVFSIIIPVYNHLDDTLRCLMSIALAGDQAPYEIIIADDCSSDATSTFIPECAGIRYIKNEKNLGFLLTCNRAAIIAKGKFIFLLNNDVIVTPNWLDSILDTFSKNSDAGLVGSKLLYPDMSLQEAGGLIWKDGSGWNYGRNDDPKKPQYNYLREVDYCSGASIAIPRALWEQVGGFDELFAPAYYEDTDLAFRIRKKGYKVFYQPLSQVFHAEGKTSGTDINAGVKSFQKINHQKFLDRWQAVIATHGLPEHSMEMVFRNRYKKLHALVIDATTPTPDMDSGSVDAKLFLVMLRDLGFQISFIPESNFLHFGQYTTDLQAMGIECLYAPFLTSVEDYLIENGDVFDLVFMSRAPVSYKYIDLIGRYAPSARVVFNTVDLHFLREERKATLGISEKTKKQIGQERDDEISVMRKVNQTILVSEHEKKVIQELAPDLKTTVIPIPREIPGRSNGYDERKDILFLGGYAHEPNVDAVFYFVEKIWPLVRTKLPGINFLIGGSNMPDSIKELEKDDILILGHVSDLDDLYSNCRLSIAPLRYGAGVKGKVVTSLSYGVPCVATTVASEGMNLEHNDTVFIADTPDKFAEAVVRVYTDQQLWEKLSENGLLFVEKRFSIEHVRLELRNLLLSIGFDL